jgi:hypothetical protein
MFAPEWGVDDKISIVRYNRPGWMKCIVSNLCPNEATKHPNLS